MPKAGVARTENGGGACIAPWFLVRNVRTHRDGLHSGGAPSKIVTTVCDAHSVLDN